MSQVIDQETTAYQVALKMVDCIQEIITERQGILVEPRNEEELLSAFNFMLDNYHSYNANELHSYAKERYSFEAVGKQFLDLYQSVLN